MLSNFYFYFFLIIKEILQFLDIQDAYFRDAADILYFTHHNLLNAKFLPHSIVLIIRAPLYDIPTAIDVLCTGSYPRLPTCMIPVRFTTYFLTIDSDSPKTNRLRHNGENPHQIDRNIAPSIILHRSSFSIFFDKDWYVIKEEYL
jgi:hypothetical protein